MARNLTPLKNLLNKDSCWDSQMDTIWSSKSLVFGRSSSYFPKNTRFLTVFWKFMIFPPLVSSWPSGMGFSILKKVCFALHRGLWTPQNHCFQGLWMHPTILKWKMKKLRFLTCQKITIAIPLEELLVEMNDSKLIFRKKSMKSNGIWYKTSPIGFLVGTVSFLYFFRKIW